MGDTTAAGPFLVTLNDVQARLSEEGDRNHHYAVVDLTLESKAGDTLDASDADYMLRDEDGYSFENGSLPDQKPRPAGQVTPGVKASGEVAFDLGTEPVNGPLTLSVSLSDKQDVAPALFEFEIEPVEKKSEPKSKVEKKGEPKPENSTAERPDSPEPEYEVISDPSGSLTIECPPIGRPRSARSPKVGEGRVAGPTMLRART
jgi:hypothetical protein